MKKYLVTGGAGFIGSNFIYYLFEKYKKDILIVNYDKLTYAGNLYNFDKLSKENNYYFIQGDICNIDKVNCIFKQHDFDVVVNFAAESHVDRSIKDPEIFVKTNILGTQVLIDVCKRYWSEGEGYKKGKKYLQVSTDEVYGSLGMEGYFSEDTPLDPHSPYAASKAGGDMLVKAYYDTYSFPMNITRCSNNYGPYQFPEKLIPLLINNALNGEKLPIYGDGLNIRDWLHVNDHCEAIDIVINSGEYGDVYNIGGNNEKTNIEIVHTILYELNRNLAEEDTRKHNIRNPLITYVKDRKGHDKRYAIDSKKIKARLGWEPRISFSKGIKDTINWYVENSEWLRITTSGEYKEYYKCFYE